MVTDTHRTIIITLSAHVQQGLINTHLYCRIVYTVEVAKVMRYTESCTQLVFAHLFDCTHTPVAILPTSFYWNIRPLQLKYLFPILSYVWRACGWAVIIDYV